MTPDDALKEIRSGKLRPVYLVVGEERHLADQVIASLREETLKGGIVGLNEDTMTAGQDSIDAVLATARTLPMLAKRRWLLVRNIEKWDLDRADGSSKAPKADKKKGKEPPLERLTAFAEEAPDSTVLVLLAAKLDKRRRLYTAAKKADFLVSCEPLDRRELPEWICARARGRGNSISRSDAHLLSELAGPDLSVVADAVERLCLFVGEGQTITEAAISELVVRVRTESVWELVKAVGHRDAPRALSVLADVYDPADRGLKLIGILGWATRQLLRFDGALKAGMNSTEAAKAAGAPPFKARELEGQLRALPAEALERWLLRLAAADLALKGGTKRTPLAVVERMVLDLCESA